MRLSAITTLVVAFVLGWSASALAGTITLSQASSDETSPEVLDAVVMFEVLTGDTLEITLSNTTTAPDDYTINELFFNASSDVSGLTLTAVDDLTAWNLFTPSVAQDTKADGFGIFDFALKAVFMPPSDWSNGVQSGDSIVFTLDIIGGCADTNTCDQDDFVGGLYQDFVDGTFSEPVDGGLQAQVAAKFVQGPLDDSAFGASNEERFPPVPEPTTLALVGLGLMGLFAFGRRGGQHRS